MNESRPENPPLPGGELSPGMRIGLLGGSFNPAHDGHLHVSREALKRLALDRVWWLVSPGNPLKDNEHLPPVDERLAAAARIAKDPRIEVSDFEERLGTRYTLDTLEALSEAAPEARFVWLMGADNLVQLPSWKSWRDIMRRVPVAVFDRPGYSSKALNGTAARHFSRCRLPEDRATALADAEPPAWVFVTGIRNPATATAIRQRRQP